MGRLEFAACALFMAAVLALMIWVSTFLSLNFAL